MPHHDDSRGFNVQDQNFTLQALQDDKMSS